MLPTSAELKFSVCKHIWLTLQTEDGVKQVLVCMGGGQLEFELGGLLFFFGGLC